MCGQVHSSERSCNHGVRRASGIMHNICAEEGVVPDFERRGSRVVSCFALFHSFARASSSSFAGALAATHGMFRRGAADLHEDGNRICFARASRIRTGDMRGILSISRQRYVGGPELRFAMAPRPTHNPHPPAFPPTLLIRPAPVESSPPGSLRQVQHGMGELGA